MKCLIGEKAAPLEHCGCSHTGTIRQTQDLCIRKEMAQRAFTALFELWPLVTCSPCSWDQVITELLLAWIIVKWSSHTWGKSNWGFYGENILQVVSQNFSSLLFGGLCPSPLLSTQPGLQNLLSSPCNPLRLIWLKAREFTKEAQGRRG